MLSTHVLGTIDVIIRITRERERERERERNYKSKSQKGSPRKFNE